MPRPLASALFKAKNVEFLVLCPIHKPYEGILLVFTLSPDYIKRRKSCQAPTVSRQYPVTELTPAHRIFYAVSK